MNVFVDSVSPVRAVQYAFEQGLDQATCGLALRLHLSVPIVLQVENCSAIVFGARSSALLTGTRSASSLARLPLLDVVEKIENLGELCFSLDGFKGAFASFVDNLWIPHTSVESAEFLFGRIRLVLREEWQLDFGADSLSIMPCAHYPHLFTTEFKIKTEMHVLGCVVSNSGSLEPDFNDARARAWRSFWCSFGPALRSLPLHKNMLWLSSRVLSSFSFKLATWPFNPAVVTRLDGIQVRMIQQLIDIPWHINDTLDSY